MLLSTTILQVKVNPKHMAQASAMLDQDRSRARADLARVEQAYRVSRADTVPVAQEVLIDMFGNVYNSLPTSDEYWTSFLGLRTTTDIQSLYSTLWLTAREQIQLTEELIDLEKLVGISILTLLDHPQRVAISSPVLSRDQLEAAFVILSEGEHAPASAVSMIHALKTPGITLTVTYPNQETWVEHHFKETSEVTNFVNALRVKGISEVGDFLTVQNYEGPADLPYVKIAVKQAVWLQSPVYDQTLNPDTRLPEAILTTPVAYRKDDLASPETACIQLGWRVPDLSELEVPSVLEKLDLLRRKITRELSTESVQKLREKRILNELRRRIASLLAHEIRNAFLIGTKANVLVPPLLQETPNIPLIQEFARTIIPSQGTLEYFRLCLGTLTELTANPESLKIDAIPMADSINNTILLVKNKFGSDPSLNLDIKTDIAPGSNEIHTIFLLMEMLVLTTIDNAVKVNGRRAGEPPLNVSVTFSQVVENDIPYLQVEIKDDGIGFPQEVLAVVNNRSTQAQIESKTGGSGSALKLLRALAGILEDVSLDARNKDISLLEFSNNPEGGAKVKLRLLMITRAH